MTGIDTNVLVRFLTADDPEQFEIAKSVIEEVCSDASPGVISVVVVCELTWVLDRAFGLPRNDVVGVLRNLLSRSNLVIERRDAVHAAVLDFETGPAGFSDYLLAQIHVDPGATQTVTFDKKASRHKHFKLLGQG